MPPKNTATTQLTGIDTQFFIDATHLDQGVIKKTLVDVVDRLIDVDV